MGVSAFVLIAAAVLYFAVGLALALSWAMTLWVTEFEWPRWSELAVIMLFWPVPVWRLARDAMR
jgi:hypothetical protein